MSANPETHRPSLALRLTTLAFPPLGLVILWRSDATLGRKILGTIGVLLYCIPYAALIIFALLNFASLQVEWRGGYIPALTWHVTRPDYDALERHRAGLQTAKDLESQRLMNSAVTGVGPGSFWPGFRGARRDGRYDGPILTNWPTDGLTALWRQPCGGGYGSFCVVGDQAFTIEQRRSGETAVAYDLKTGQEVWVNTWEGSFSEAMGGDGPRSTPTFADGHLYTLGAEGEFRCLDAASGKPLWSHNILKETDAPVPAYGAAVSPLVFGHSVLLLTGSGRTNSIVCYDTQTGLPSAPAPVLKDRTGYASPILVTLAGQEQLIICAEERTVGMTVPEGKILWEYPWRVLHNQMPIAQPVMLASNHFLLSAGYFTGSAAVEIMRIGEIFKARTVWQNKNLKNKFSSSVYLNGYIYGLDEDILTCLDAETGERKWKDGRYGYGQLILASGHLVILSGDGELSLVKATPERWTELAHFQAIHGKTWNHPALAGGLLLVRNAAEMACFDLRPK